MSHYPSLLKVPIEPGGKPERGKVSEMIVEFAEPRLYADPAGPPSVAAVRSIMQLAEMCWNLPVLEVSGSPLYANAKRSFDEALAAMPSLASRLLERLIDDRKTKFAAIPFSVVLRVEGDDLDNLRVAAEARMPRTPEPPRLRRLPRLSTSWSYTGCLRWHRSRRSRTTPRLDDEGPRAELPS